MFEEFSRFHDERYGAFSTLLRTTFDEAITHFADGTVDLLHIDGCHTYEAVRHDFESWRPKLSQHAVVLFHDTNEHKSDFGVWRLWAELCEEFPHFEFLHGHGLGVLAFGESVEPTILALCHLSDPAAIASLRSRFAALGERCLSQTREKMLAQDLGQRFATSVAQALQAEARARDAEARASESERAREQILHRINAARRDVYDANLRAEQAQARAAQAEAQARQAWQEREAVLSSTVWRATRPLRTAGHGLPPELRRALRAGAKLGWWSLTLRLPRKLRERRAALALQSASPAAPADLPPNNFIDLQPNSPTPQITSTAEPAPTNEAVEFDPGPTGRDEALRIVYVSGEPGTPGHFYRVVRPLAGVGSGGAWMRADEIPARLREIESAKILVLWRTPWDEKIAAAVKSARSSGAKIIFDIDDLMIDPNLARLDMIDGIRSQGFTEDGVRGHYERVRQTMLAADLCTAATEELGFHLRSAGKPTHVLPNGFDHASHDLSRRAAIDWQRTRTDQLIRIGYAGGSRTHQRDLGLAIEAIARLLRENPVCRLVLFRALDLALPLVDIEEYPVLAGLEDRIEWRPLQPLANLPSELARFDINLAPLEFGNPFCEAKSELKFFEAALVDVPTIASPTGPFRRAIEHGKNGFLAATANDWHVYLKQLVDDPGLRHRIGRSAYHTSLATWGPIQRAARLGRIFDQALGGMPGANAFALEAYLSTRPQQAPKIFDSDIVFERNANGHADVTVVIPLYNYETYVVEALDSVRKQTLHPLDLVVVDGSSTDNSLSIAKAWAEKNATRFNRIAVLQNRANYGLAFCRNSGFDAAQSTYILPLDADNVLAPKCCEVLLETVQRAGAAYAYSTLQDFGDSSNLRGNAPYDPQRFVAGNYIDAMALVSKEAWAIIGGYDHVRHGWEDFDFWCCLAEQGLRGVWRPEVLAYYRVHQVSITKQTVSSESFRTLMADFKRRHPWVSLIHQHRRFPQPDAHLVEPVAQTRLDKLLPLLRCPLSKSRLAYNADRSALISVDGLHSWPIHNGRPVLSPSRVEPKIYSDQHISNDVPDIALDLIRNTNGMVLNLSAGGSREKFDHVVEVEYGIFRHTDIVADAHELPFYDETFDAVIVMNAFEHYREPCKVAAELLRVLKPNGHILVRTAFLQPLHEAPWHFYNCTRYGLAEWFKDFDIERLYVSENFCPNYSIAWLASEVEAALRSDVSADSADAFRSTPIGALVDVWRDPSKRATSLWTNFYKLLQPTQEITAAGFELFGRKPPRIPDLAGTRTGGL